MAATWKSPWVSQVREEGRKEGRRAAGLAKGIFLVLEHRGIGIDDVSRERIESCSDPEVVAAWLRRSFDVATASELFT